MIQLQGISRKALFLVLLLMVSASYASASSFVFTNSTTTNLSPAQAQITGITFSQVDVLTTTDPLERILRISAPTSNDVVGSFTLSSGGGPFDLISVGSFATPYDLHFFETAPNVYSQGISGNSFFFTTSWQGTDSFGPFNYDVQIDSSFLDLSNPSLPSWTILGLAHGGATWKFQDSGQTTGESVDNIVFQGQQAATAVPEASSIYLLTMGLGFGAQFLRRGRSNKH